MVDYIVDMDEIQSKLRTTSKGKKFIVENGPSKNFIAFERQILLKILLGKKKEFQRKGFNPKT